MHTTIPFFFIENCFFNHATLFMFHMNYSQAWILPFRQFSRASSSFYTICRKNNSTYHIIEHVSLYYILLLVDLPASKYFAFGKFNLSALYNKLWLTPLLYSKTDHFFVDRYILAVASAQHQSIKSAFIGTKLSLFLWRMKKHVKFEQSPFPSQAIYKLTISF